MKIYGVEPDTFILKELGTRIKDTRIGLSMTREELCAHAGISISSIVRIESGVGVNLDVLLKVLRSLNCLQNLDLLVPEQEQTPQEIFKGKQKRKRASKKKQENTWIWGDEQ